MDCYQLQNSLEDYEEKSLSKFEAEAAQRHLQECAACAKSRKFLNTAWDALDALPVEESDPFAPRRLLAKLQGRVIIRRYSSALAAALVIVVLAGQWLFVPLRDNLSTTPATEVTSSTDSLVSDLALLDPGANQEANADAELVALSDMNALNMDEMNLLFAEEMFSNQQEVTP